MKNLHLLPTEKPSRLHTWINDKGLRAALYEEPQLENPNTAKNIYITSDEEIKDGEWHLHYYENKPVISKSHNNAVKTINEIAEQFGYKKIILTTDQDLINDGVQAIDDEFLEWYTKNPNCEEVEVIQLRKSSGYYDKEEVWHWDFLAYKIIIPKEEPKQDRTCTNNCSVVCGECQILEPKQETVEDAAEKWVFDINGNRWSNNDNTAGDNYGSFITGAKWQQEQNKNLYSEEDMIEFADFYYQYKELIKLNNWEIIEISKEDVFKKWFEQFKKK